MKNFIAAIVIFMASIQLFGQNNVQADAVLGTYLSENGTGKVQVTKENGKYIGTLVWTKDDGAKDEKNPDEKLRSRTLVGTVILKDMTFDGESQWKGGTIYDPESGNTYKCTIKRKPNGDLTLRGFIGVSVLGRNSAWKKVQ